MKHFRFLVLLVALASASAATFDQYIQTTEEEMDKHRGFEDFLWLDHHRDQKSLVWLGQSRVMPLEPVPDGAIQHWLGVVYLEGATLKTASDTVFNFPAYKDFFKQQVLDSKFIKLDGDQVNFQMRLYKKQLSTVLLNVNETAKYTVIDPSRATGVMRSTHIGEVEHPKDAKSWDHERKAEDESGYLERLNFYWRFEQADNGVYAELEVISQGREPGGLSPSRFLHNFQSFPRELTQGMIDGIHDLFPHRR